MMTNTINIGTRGSKLALYQANVVKDKFNKLFPEIATNIVIIKTKGDIILDTALSKIGDKGLFTKELEVALLEKKIDIAVHSLKDMPTNLPNNLKVGAVVERGEIRDALVSKHGKKLHELDKNCAIATSSLRRKASLLKYNPDFNVIDIRGNVQSRLQKMNKGHCEAMVMAAAGLKRLDLDNYITEMLPTDIFIPAVGQGAIGIECRKEDPATDAFLEKINHRKTWIAAIAERSFMHTLQGGCQVPVGCFTEMDEKQITLTGFISSVDGSNYLKAQQTGNISEPEKTGRMLAEILISQGGMDILNNIKKDRS